MKGSEIEITFTELEFIPKPARLTPCSKIVFGSFLARCSSLGGWYTPWGISCLEFIIPLKIRSLALEVEFIIDWAGIWNSLCLEEGAKLLLAGV